MKDLQRIADNLSILMKRRGLTSQMRLAEAAGISQTNLSNILRCSVSPTLETLTRLAGALRVETWQLLAPADVSQVLKQIHGLTPTDRALLDRLLESLGHSAEDGR